MSLHRAPEKSLDSAKPLSKSYVTWKRNRIRGSGSVWKRGSEIFKMVRKRVRVGSEESGHPEPAQKKV
ncbi:hypothetical protein YC2023_088674 [Brassica napus]